MEGIGEFGDQPSVSVIHLVSYSVVLIPCTVGCGLARGPTQRPTQLLLSVCLSLPPSLSEYSLEQNRLSPRELSWRQCVSTGTARQSVVPAVFCSLCRRKHTLVEGGQCNHHALPSPDRIENNNTNFFLVTSSAHFWNLFYS